SCWRQCEGSWSGHDHLHREPACRYRSRQLNAYQGEPGPGGLSLRSALLLPEGIARRVDTHHDSARIEELQPGGAFAADGARLVQQSVSDEHVRLRTRRRRWHGRVLVASTLEAPETENRRKLVVKT